LQLADFPYSPINLNGKEEAGLLSSGFYLELPVFDFARNDAVAQSRNYNEQIYANKLTKIVLIMPRWNFWYDVVIYFLKYREEILSQRSVGGVVNNDKNVGAPRDVKEHCENAAYGMQHKQKLIQQQDIINSNQKRPAKLIRTRKDV